MLNDKITKAYEEILIEELQLAMGCTEPIAIAYGASILRDVLQGFPTSIVVKLSGNIIKNVKSVIVPSTGGLHGIETAVCAGIVAGQPQKRLEVLSVLTKYDQQTIANYLNTCNLVVEELNTPCTFDLYLEATLGNDVACVRISEDHTNVVYVKLNGEDCSQKYLNSGAIATANQIADRSLLTVEDIVTFADTANLDRIKPYLLRQIELNMAIANEGLSNYYGAAIGQLLYRDGKADLTGKAKAFAAAGSDARMSGCELPVCIISGSGNQGITTCVPVVVFANEMGVDQDKLLRALVVADLVTIHQKTGIGCLSAYCGAISAGCGCGAGICYLQGGSYQDVAHTVVNAVAILSGTICDGAKPSCAAKIAMAVEAGIMGCEMAQTKRQFFDGDGIVTKGVENTIKNVGLLAREGMSETDKKIISIMLGKED